MRPFVSSTAHVFHTACATELLQRYPNFGILQSACPGCAVDKDAPISLPSHLTQSGFFPLRIDVGIGSSWKRSPGQIKPPSSMRVCHTKETHLDKLQEKIDQLTLDAVTTACQLRFSNTLQEDLKRKLDSSRNWIGALSHALGLANDQSNHKRMLVQEHQGLIAVFSVEKDGCLPKLVTQKWPPFDAIDYERLAGRLEQHDEGPSSEPHFDHKAPPPEPMHLAFQCMRLLPDIWAGLFCGWSIYKICYHRSSVASAVLMALVWLVDGSVGPYFRFFARLTCLGIVIYSGLVLVYACTRHETYGPGYCYTGFVWLFIAYKLDIDPDLVGHLRKKYVVAAIIWDWVSRPFPVHLRAQPDLPYIQAIVPLILQFLEERIPNHR